MLEAFVKDTEVIRQRQSDATRSIDEGKAKLAEVKAEIARVGDSKAAAQQVLEIGSIGGEFSELLRAMRAQLPVTAQLAAEHLGTRSGNRRRTSQTTAGRGGAPRAR